MKGWEPAAQVDALAPMLALLPPKIPTEAAASEPPEIPREARTSLRPEIPPAQPDSKAPKTWLRYLGSTLALVLGCLTWIAGVSNAVSDPSHVGGLLVAGPVMILGALAYRSAKKRKLGEAKSLAERKVVEVLLLLAICAIVLMQKNLKELIATDPFSNLLVPLWAIVAYLVVILTPGWTTAETASAERQEGPTLDEMREEAVKSYEASRASTVRAADITPVYFFTAFCVAMMMLAVWFSANPKSPGVLSQTAPTQASPTANQPNGSCDIFVGKQCVLHASENDPVDYLNHNGWTVTVRVLPDKTSGLTMYYVEASDGWGGAVSATELSAVP